jgi:hypothetical protein
MRISPSFPVLLARGVQAFSSAAVTGITSLLLATRKGRPEPLMLNFAVGVGLSTLTAALVAIIFHKSLHPWIRITVDGVVLSLNLAVGFVSLPNSFGRFLRL